MSSLFTTDRVPGVATHSELHFRFALWFASQRAEPSIRAITDRFNVHRATAFRWRRDVRIAMGVPTA